MSDSQPADLCERIRQEHEELRELLGSVHRMLAGPLESAAKVVETLKSLQRHVQAHFYEEENGGFFDDIVAEAPRMSERAESIKREHTRLSDAMQELVCCAEEVERDDGRQLLEAKFHDFSKELMHHETRENEMLLETYDDDIGSKD